jgi:hypothetical protein
MKVSKGFGCGNVSGIPCMICSLKVIVLGLVVCFIVTYACFHKINTIGKMNTRTTENFENCFPKLLTAIIHDV